LFGALAGGLATAYSWYKRFQVNQSGEGLLSGSRRRYLRGVHAFLGFTTCLSDGGAASPRFGKIGQKKTETREQSHEAATLAGGFVGMIGPREMMAANRIGAIMV
jgi:hypothetical protein